MDANDRKEISRYRLGQIIGLIKIEAPDEAVRNSIRLLCRVWEVNDLKFETGTSDYEGAAEDAKMIKEILEKEMPEIESDYNLYLKELKDVTIADMELNTLLGLDPWPRGRGMMGIN